MQIFMLVRVGDKCSCCLHVKKQHIWANSDSNGSIRSKRSMESENSTFLYVGGTHKWNKWTSRACQTSLLLRKPHFSLICKYIPLFFSDPHMGWSIKPLRCSWVSTHSLPMYEIRKFLRLTYFDNWIFYALK